MYEYGIRYCDVDRYVVVVYSIKWFVVCQVFIYTSHTLQINHHHMNMIDLLKLKRSSLIFFLIFVCDITFLHLISVYVTNFLNSYVYI